MTTYCPWLTLSHMLFAHLGFGRKLPSSKQQYSKTLMDFTRILLLAIAGNLGTLRHRHLPAGSGRVCCWAAWHALGPGISHAQRYGEVPSWKPEARSCDGHCRGITHLPPMHCCEVLLFSAGQLLSF